MERKNWKEFFKVFTGTDEECLVRTGLQEYMQWLARNSTVKNTDRKTQVNALENQINPHFLYNTLESIRGQALVSGADEIARTTEALAIFFRYSISQSKNVVSLREEINNIKNYFLIQKYRFNDKFFLEIESDDKDVFNYVLPKLTLQPIVENAIFHGLETKESGGTVRILIESTAKRLLITVSDDGIGMSPEILDHVNHVLLDNQSDILPEFGKGTGIALVNVNRRIRLLFGNQYGLQIYSTPDKGTDVEIVLPLIKIDNVLQEKQI